MIEANTFRIEWDTGEVNVQIDSFFIEASVARIKKLCKLARQYSSAADHKTLMLTLIQADRARKELLDALGELSYKKSELANSFFHTTIEPEKCWAERRLIRERVQLARSINILKAEVWGT